MKFHITQHPEWVQVELDGMSVLIGRSELDGALMIDIDTTDLGITDAHPGDLVPRLALAINDHSEQLDADGKWVARTGYPTLTVLDHIVAQSDG